MAETKQTKKPTIPANAKKPQDRQTAKKDVLPDAVHVEWEGQDYTIESEAFADAEVLEYLVEAQAGQGQYFILALKTLLGPQQWVQYKQHTKANADSGRVSSQAAREFFEHVMKAGGSGNS